MATLRRFLYSSFGLATLLALCAAGKADAPKVSAQYQPICAFGQDLCAAFEATRAAVAAEEAAPPPRDGKKVLEVLDRFTALRERYNAALKDGWDPIKNTPAPVKAIADPPFIKLVERVNALGLAAVPESLAELGKLLGLLEARADALEAKTAEAGPKEPLIAELRGINETATKVWARVEEGSFAVARMGGVMSTNPDGSFKKLSPQGEIVAGNINPLQERLAALGKRLAELDGRLGGTLAREAASDSGPKAPGTSLVAEKLEGKGLLANPFGAKAPEQTPEGPTPWAQEGNPGKEIGSVVQGGRPSLIIRPTPSLPELQGREVSWLGSLWAQVTGKREVFYAGEPGQDSFPEETRRIEKLRAQGKTDMAGDPVGRARYVYSQEGGTCGIASQGQIIAASKKLPPDPRKMRGLEDVLFDRAVAQKCFPNMNPLTGTRHGGSTPTHCMSRLLEEEGFLVRRYFGATNQELAGVLRKGKMVVLSLNSQLLWGTGSGVWHAVVSTGAEFERGTGKLLGVYINDTGYDPPTGGRFVNAIQFWEAWRQNGSVIIEPL